jgi:phosphoglucomutase/phosphomannomutase
MKNSEVKTIKTKKEDIKKLLDESKQGFNTLKLPEKYSKSALKFLEEWLTDDTFKDYVPQIIYLIKSKKWGFLLDAFYQVIPFGTGGRRGLVGIGPNRINKWTIMVSAQGHSQYLIKKYGNNAKKRGVVLAYDVRRYTQKGIYNDKISNPVMNLDCKDLAIAAAEVYAANNIKTYTFKEIRSTPELSFAIRYLKCVGGDMFSASHNLPTDNGKKVYDQYGGQLIPPDDQKLVDEVTQHVKGIKIIDFKKGLNKKIIKEIGKDVDDAYIKNVCSISLSKQHNLNILYSPLHGTGKTSYYPVLKKLGFNVVYDTKTSNLSGAFENVTFNVPNPEVKESFNTLLRNKKRDKFDILINSDPDADRMGVVAKDNGSWKFLNGNEIGILLTDYGINKYKISKKLNKNSTMIKTEVTSSLIEQIAKKNKVNCIGNLLVGFKYIGEEMNKLEDQGKINDFILGTEESHGYIMGNYVRDKDGAAAAVWISELAAELKKQDKTLFDNLNEIYSKYGYCLNYLTEIRLLGAKGMEDISKIMSHLRKKKIKSFGKFKVINKGDKWTGSKHVSKTDTASRNVLVFNIKNLNSSQSIKVTVRPSGTEPKVKFYFEVFGNAFNMKDIGTEKKKLADIKNEFEKVVIKYCCKIIGTNFPDRGFLLFWQLPLNDKMKYFKIEKKIIKLKKIKNKNRREKELNQLLEFLGANPIEKINNAFKNKYKKGILEYLNL